MWQQDFGDGDMDANDPADGHGTHVASIVAEMLPGVDLILLKATRDVGGGNFFHMQSALDWVISNADTYDIAAVNISIGEDEGFYTTPTTHETEPEIYPIHDELEELAELAIPVITGAGNHFFEEDSVQGVTFPAAHPLTIGVGATWDESGSDDIEWVNKYPFIGASDNTRAPDRVLSMSFRDEDMTEIFAPGAWLDGAWLNGGTSEEGGTSGAAPHVAAAAVLARQLNDEFGYQAGNFTMGQLVDLFQDTGVLINDGDDENDNVTNTGLDFRRLDVEAMAYKLFKPSAPDLVASSDWGFSDSDNATGNTTPTFTGTAPTNAHVWLYVDGVAVADTQLTGGATTYNLTPTSPLTMDGDWAVTIRVAENGSVPASNRSQSSTTLTVLNTESKNLSSESFTAKLSDSLTVTGSNSGSSTLAINWVTSPLTLTKTGTGTITFGATAISDRTVSVTYVNNAGTTNFNVNTGTAGSASATNWTVNVNGSNVVFDSSVQNLAALNIGASGVATVAFTTPTPPATTYKVLHLRNLTIAGTATQPTGKLDLTNNALILDYTGSSPEVQIRQWIIAGRGGPGMNPTWTGNGITSSTAAANPGGRSLGYGDNGSLPLGAYLVFMGQSVDNTTVLVRYTVWGDTNLDGTVNDDDVTVVGASYAPSQANPSWANGDLDYNGFVDDDDVTVIGILYDPLWDIDEDATPQDP